jgi:hypothetical protein
MESLMEIKVTVVNDQQRERAESIKELLHKFFEAAKVTVYTDDVEMLNVCDFEKVYLDLNVIHSYIFTDDEVISDD